MESTIAGMKELNRKIDHIDDSLAKIARSLEQLVKIQNRKIAPQTTIPIRFTEEEVDDTEDPEE